MPAIENTTLLENQPSSLPLNLDSFRRRTIVLRMVRGNQYKLINQVRQDGLKPREHGVYGNVTKFVVPVYIL